MSIENVILVNPVEYLVDETFKFGWGSEDLIHMNFVSCWQRYLIYINGTCPRKRAGMFFIAL